MRGRPVVSAPFCIHAKEITKRTLAEAWQRTAARHALLDEVGLPPVALSDDELEEWSELAEEAEDGGLRLLLDEDGT
ncbi:TilS substrate-binding domain-containing protein [Streptomyces sp. NPDC058686]|uniref:TilS substrate-binding domain-containing protein n=1 Tax=Streptomyces sp. NPDC058686 TaxID=3346599 RepID=UPI003661D052